MRNGREMKEKKKEEARKETKLGDRKNREEWNEKREREKEKE